LSPDRRLSALGRRPSWSRRRGDVILRGNLKVHWLPKGSWHRCMLLRLHVRTREGEDVEPGVQFGSARR
jgi:hypothetical protein